MENIQLKQVMLTNDAANSLEAFIALFNDMIKQSELMADTINHQTNEVTRLKDQASTATLLKNQVDGYKRKIDADTDQINQLETRTEEMSKLLLQAEKNAHTQMGLVRELEMSRAKSAELQRQLTELKGPDSPARLKEQLKRVKAKSEEKSLKITRLETEAKTFKKQLADADQRDRRAVDKINSLITEKNSQSLTGILHDGNNHLIMWPQENTVQGQSGDIYNCRSLFYMHQSGTGRLITFDKENMTAVICKPPKGGIYIPANVKRFAEDWLFNVNVTQNGTVTPSDIKMTDLNS
tara:strand:- start:10516 stop:11400 length:885 start_codon:yes stop_codon:yes gene_type:complete